MKSYILRRKFLDYFKSKKHKIVESDSLVPRDDPTVLFTPAGMNQFKKEFMGVDSGFSRAATAQRCLRTDDLDKVGKTSGHHTFFEMLGNFSFGDYFKRDAVGFAWEFLTGELCIDKGRLWASVYKDDDESYEIWADVIGLPRERIVRLGDKDNFWPAEAKEKGPNGPCGPCSEIFFDQGKNVGCEMPACNPACSCGRFLEIWNLVFTQFNRLEDGSLSPLPHKNIDTGMGLERLSAVMQGVSSNFETDLFKPLVAEITAHCSPEYPREREYLYAVADHIRAVTFAIYDGVMPSNEARGYVVRKIIRKSAFHARSLGFKRPFLHTLVPVLAEIMAPAYPDLKERRENIAQIIRAEEKNFIHILNSSDALLKDKFERFQKDQDPREAGRLVFQVYDTYGLPLELTQKWLNAHGVRMSEEAFRDELAAQRTRSKLQSAMKGDVFSSGDFDYGISSTKFTGYKETSVKAKILKILNESPGSAMAEVKGIREGENAVIILDETVFYPESGGQVGDTGELIKGKSVFKVTDTKKAGKLILHKGAVVAGGLRRSDVVTARIEEERRLAVARNHTATHMLQAALRKVLGPHIQQQGSLVAQDRLRFDFTHFRDVTREQLDRIEEIIAGYILHDYSLESRQMALAQAKKTGALAFFGEKYDSRVRVVAIGDFSKELCAGTHLSSTGQIGYFKITHESSVAGGVRRIEAVTGISAFHAVKREEEILQRCTEILNTAVDRLPQELEKLLARAKELEKKLSAQKIGEIHASIDAYIRDNRTDIGGISFIRFRVHNTDMNGLRNIVDTIKRKTASNTFIAVASVAAQDKVLLVVGMTQDMVEKGFNARDYTSKERLLPIQGSGGGRSDFAQAGGSNPSGLDDLFIIFQESIRNQISQP